MSDSETLIFYKNRVVILNQLLDKRTDELERTEQRALIAEKRLEKAVEQRNALAQELGQDDDNGAEEIRLCDEQLASITAESGE